MGIQKGWELPYVPDSGGGAEGGTLIYTLDCGSYGFTYDSSDTATNLFAISGSVDIVVSIVCSDVGIYSGYFCQAGTCTFKIGITGDLDYVFGEMDLGIMYDPLTTAWLGTVRAAWSLNMPAGSLETCTAANIIASFTGIDGDPGSFGVDGTIKIIVSWTPTVPGSGATVTIV